MSDFVDRLERALLTAGRSPAAGRPRPRRSAGGGKLLVISSVAVTAAVVAVVVVVGVSAHGGHSSALPGGRTGGAQPPAPAVRVAAACRPRTVDGHLVAPPLVRSSAPPAAALLDELAVLRRPAGSSDHVDLKHVDRSPFEAIRIFTRYVRVVDGVEHTRLVLIPATVCSTPTTTLKTAPTTHDVLLMQILGPKFSGPRPTIYVGTAEQIRKGPALPGLDDTTAHRAWLQATVVPDGVATVTMQFTPPLNRHYVRTVGIHDNVGMAFPLPAYTPTTTIWYGADGRRLMRFVDRRALKYDQCLARHRRDCTS